MAGITQDDIDAKTILARSLYSHLYYKNIEIGLGTRTDRADSRIPWVLS